MDKTLQTRTAGVDSFHTALAAERLTCLLLRCIAGNTAQMLEAQLAEAQEAVRAQGLTVEEVTRLKTDHDTITHSFQETQKHLATAREQFWDREMKVSRKGDVLESNVAQYNNLVYQLGLHSSPPAEAGDVSFLLMYEPSGTTEREMLSGDVHGALLPALTRLDTARRAEKTRLEGAIIEVEHRLDELNALVEAQKEEIESQVASVKSANDQVESQRNVRRHC